VLQMMHMYTLIVDVITLNWDTSEEARWSPRI